MIASALSLGEASQSAFMIRFIAPSSRCASHSPNHSSRDASMALIAIWVSSSIFIGFLKYQNHIVSTRSRFPGASQWIGIGGIFPMRGLWTSWASWNWNPRIWDHLALNFSRDSFIIWPALISGAEANVADQRW